MNFLKFLSSGINYFQSNLSGSQRINSNIFQSNKSPSPNNQTTQAGFKEITDQIKFQERPKLEIKSIVNQHQSIDLINKPIQPKQFSIEEILINQQQQLINQYIHLNFQLLNKNLQADLNQKVSLDKNEEAEYIKSMKKKIKKPNQCGHLDKQHYAKGMCNNCYHKFGRTKKPWNCTHEKLYAGGMCQNCYINKYNKNKRDRESERMLDHKSLQTVNQQQSEKQK